MWKVALNAIVNRLVSGARRVPAPARASGPGEFAGLPVGVDGWPQNGCPDPSHFPREAREAPGVPTGLRTPQPLFGIVGLVVVLEEAVVVSFTSSKGRPRRRPTAMGPSPGSPRRCVIVNELDGNASGDMEGVAGDGHELVEVLVDLLRELRGLPLLQSDAPHRHHRAGQHRTHGLAAGKAPADGWDRAVFAISASVGPCRRSHSGRVISMVA